MATSDAEIRTARAAGRFAARTGRPLTDCPYDPATQQLLTVWFIRGYRSTNDPTDAPIDVQQTGERGR